MPSPGPWSARHVVHDLLAVGSIGFFGPPVDGEVEVGYGLVEPVRGRGLATEALQALLAETDRLGIRVRAAVEPDNRASIRVLAKCGFTELRGVDGEGHLVMARPLPGGGLRAPTERPRRRSLAATVRLVATDLDGTLLRSDGTLSDRTRATLAAVEDAGIPVVFVTARPLRWMDDLWPWSGRTASRSSATARSTSTWPPARCGPSTAWSPRPGWPSSRRCGPPYRTRSSRSRPSAASAARPTYDVADHAPPGSPVGPMEEVWDVVALKLLVRHPGPDHDGFRDAVVAAVGEAGVATWTLPGLVEVSAPGVTKAAALERLCDGLGVRASEVLAFGDMPNDLAMLGWAGTSYAVANAHPSRHRGRRPHHDHERRRRGGPGARPTGPRGRESVLMAPVTARSHLRHAGRRAVAAVLVALLGLALTSLLGLLGLAALAAPASAEVGAGMATEAGAGLSAAAPTEGDDEPTEIFVGRVQDVEEVLGESPNRNRVRFSVDVLIVFGDTTVDTTEVKVLTVPGLDRCAAFPKDRRTQRYLFRLTNQSGRLVAQKCSDIVEFGRSDQAAVVEEYGDARQPGPPPPPEPPVVELDPVTYTCPDTNEAIADVTAPVDDCPALDDPTTTDRAAAPGLALAIVGVLGLVVVRRLGRRSSAA